MADVLVVDDQDRYIDLCRAAIPEHHYRGPARDAAEALELLAAARGRIELVLLDVRFDIPAERLLGYSAGMAEAEIEALRRRQGLQILDAIRSRHPDLPVILMTSREELSLEAEVPVDEDYTYFLDDDYVDARALQGRIHALTSSSARDSAHGPIYWGSSRRMQRVRHRLEVLARGRLPVVLLGPTGTGKSLIARHYVHERSGRSGRFVAVDLSTVPTELVAAHLFGSVRGAYTGAVTDRVGAFEAADGGTLFLDEVGNLSEAAQKMLLTVLQDGRLCRVGDLKERLVDVKLVVATNEDLAARVREGSFRADLYMRLNPATAVALPPLADRGHDLAQLLDFCLRGALQRPYLRELIAGYRRGAGLGSGPIVIRAGHAPPTPAPDTLVILFPDRSLRLLRQHPWPGNLREFAMTVENAVLFALAELAEAAAGDRADVVTVRPKLLRDLLSTTAPAAEPTGGANRVLVDVRPEDTLNKVSVGCERQYFTELYLRAGGDFRQMAIWLLADPDASRKVQLRLNQLGLKVRELKEQLP